jgi:hypothetical protein
VQYSQVIVGQPDAAAAGKLNPFDSDEDDAEDDSEL